MQNQTVDTEPENIETVPDEQKYLTFWTDSELFGISISDVVQIIRMQEITPLPGFPDYTKGVINLRGFIIPVIDMRIRLKKATAAYNENTCIIVTDINDSYIGFIVDTVDEVTNIGSDCISPAPQVSRNPVNRYLTGIGRLGEKVVLLLDPSKILSEDELSEVTQAAEESQDDSDLASADASDKADKKAKTGEKTEKAVPAETGEPHITLLNALPPEN